MKIDNMTLTQARAALRKVIPVARGAQREEGWCESGFRAAVEEIGLIDELETTRIIRLELALTTVNGDLMVGAQQIAATIADVLAEELGDDQMENEGWTVSPTAHMSGEWAPEK